MRTLLLFLLAFSLNQIAIAEPIYPDGRIGVKTDSYYAYRLMVPAGKPVQFKYGYSAGKENRVMIHDMREDKPIPIIGNYNGDFPGKVTNVFSNPVNVEYLITGYSKNCRKASRRCHRYQWVQEPIKVKEGDKSVSFDDSCNPSAGRSCTFDDSYVSWRFTDE